MFGCLTAHPGSLPIITRVTFLKRNLIMSFSNLILMLLFVIEKTELRFQARDSRQASTCVNLLNNFFLTFVLYLL